MPQFRYVARNAEGKLIDGVVTCNDRSAAIHHVEKERCVPIKIEALKDGAGTPAKVEAPSKPVAVAEQVETLTHSQLFLFTEQLAHLLSAGMTLDEALAVLVKRLKHPRLGGLSKLLHQALIEGRSLSQAMKGFPRIFSPLYYNMVSAGEASGALPDILKRLVKHLATVKALRDKVTQAMVYPAMLVVMGILLILVFIKFMVPQLLSFFTKTGGRGLPLPTQILITANDLLTHYWWVGVLVGGGVYTGFKAFTNSTEGRKQWDTFIWKLPVFSAIIRYRFYAQFARTLGTLMENGVTLLRALELLEDISGNEYVRARMGLIRKAVIDGATMSVALVEQRIFPELFADMMAIGEQSGKFDQTMQMIADVYERELDKQVQITSELIPPLVMLAIAAVVGLIVFAVLSAVFSITENLR